MASIVLKAFFKKYRDAIQSNQEYRNALNKEAVHYFQEEIENLKSQISLIDQKREKDFNIKYKQALETIKNSGMSNLTFTQISKTLRNKFLDHFTDLRDIGVDTGHVYSNLTIASKGKAQSEIFDGTKLEIREYREIESITPKDLKDIAKTIALISSYTSTLEQLDKIQNRKELVSFLKKSKTFRDTARSSDLSTLANIKSAITNSFESKNNRGLAELGDQILKDSVGSIQLDTTINMARKITATESGIAVTFEIAAFNQFKGNVSQAIKTAFTGVLDSMMQDPDGLPKAMDKALEQSLLKEFTKEDLLQLFPNVSASKTIIEAYTDILSEILKTGKSKPYSSKSKTPNSVISSKKIPLKMVGVKPKKIKVIEPSFSLGANNVTNLISLQNLINSQLQDVVSANMGTGNSRNILNYRTGRLASSAKVESISESRAGMITAFYSYMKNPYATFSDGGQQQSPKSRDPKALISKSIREIAQQQVANRLRAVAI